MKFHNDTNYLFSNGDLFSSLQAEMTKIISEIHRYTSDYILKVSLDDLTEHLVDKYKIEPIVLQKENIHIGASGDTTVDMSNDFRYTPLATRVPATFAVFVVPFTGAPEIFQLRPPTSTTNPPRANIAGQELHLRYTSAQFDATAVRADFDRDLKNIEQYLAWGVTEIAKHNRQIPETIRHHLNIRKEKFLSDKGVVAALGFPIKNRQGQPDTYAAPLARKKLPIQMPKVPTGAFKPEPTLEMEHYEHILGVISNMVQVMERSPQAFSKMGEEDLRTHILVQLNGHYEGQATGETFNFEGKTDILVRAEGRNIFIGECKIWKGAVAFTETIDQLLGYTAWRDTKTAIVLFNRNKNTSSVVAQIPDLVKQHPNFKRESTGYKHESASRFILHQYGDKNRELVLTVLVFDVPA